MKRIASIFIALSLCTLPCFNVIAEDSAVTAAIPQVVDAPIEVTQETIDSNDTPAQKDQNTTSGKAGDDTKANEEKPEEPAQTQETEPTQETKPTQKPESTQEPTDEGTAVGESQTSGEQAAKKAKVAAAKEKEQSAENKLLGATTMMATGMGAMELASSMSEQKADQEAEDQMRAYLSTFYCQYGNKRVPGGNKNVETGGGNELVNLYAQYVNLANDLKARKAALDIAPGIESEAILDSATAGLYDDVNIGPRGSMFTSLARALQDPTGEDAQKWKAQQEESAKGIKDGAIALGVGAIGSAVIDLAINHTGDKDKDNEDTEKSELCTKGGLGKWDATNKECTCKTSTQYYGRELQFNNELHICTTLADVEIDGLTKKEKEKLQTCNKSAKTHAWNIEQEECVTKPTGNPKTGYGI